jgi:hypothetical protein
MEPQEKLKRIILTQQQYIRTLEKKLRREKDKNSDLEASILRLKIKRI